MRSGDACRGSMGGREKAQSCDAGEASQNELWGVSVSNVELWSGLHVLGEFRSIIDRDGR